METRDSSIKINKSRLGIALVLVIVMAVLFFGPGACAPRQATSGFLVTDLSIEPTEVEPNDPVTITVLVANTHDTWGIYSLVLQINGVKEAGQEANVAAHGSERISFSVARQEPGKYRVFINGLSGSFSVVGKLKEE